MSRGRAVWAFVSLLLLGSALGASSAAAQTSRPEITRIDFQGNEVFSDSELRAAIVNRQTECKQVVLQPLCWAGVDDAVDRRFLHPRELPQDIQRLEVYYRLRGFRDVVVDTVLVREGGAVKINFTIAEGDPVVVRSLDIFGLEEIEVPGVLANLPLRVGGPLSFLDVQAVKQFLAKASDEEVQKAEAALQDLEDQLTAPVAPAPKPEGGAR